MAKGTKWLLFRALIAFFIRSTVAAIEGAATGSRKSRIRHLLNAPRSPLIDEVARSERETTNVDYGGRHPFQRDLQSPRNLNEYQSIRIRFVTEPLTARRGIRADLDAKIETITNRVLPFIEESWSKHLSVFPVQSPISISASSCFGFYDTETPQTLLDNGIPNADVAILVSAQDYLTTGAGQEINFCTGQALARAKTCSLDQNERPVLGYLNFCIEGDTLQTENQILETSLVGVHEVGHILAMDSDLFLFFRDSITGEPLTPRPFNPQQVECVDGTVRTSVIPAETTLKKGTTNSGLVYYDVVTPRVRTVARNHFNCQQLEGARLENQPTSNSCTGNDWDERLFFTEVLSTIVHPGAAGHGAVLSPLSLALMEDSGWYKVNYKDSKLSSFGHGRGCGFVYGDCIVNDKVPDYGKGVFCDTPVHTENGQFMNNDLQIYCDPSHTSFALCDLFDSTVQPNPFGLDPSREDVRYFSDTSLTSVRAQGDFCPSPTIELGLDCTDANSDPSRKFYEGEVYGPGSRCINAHIDPGMGEIVVLPACLPLVCDETLRKVVVAGQTCEYDGQVLNFPKPAQHFFECPLLTSVCPHFFCPAGCSGRGICNYDAVPPRCNCFDASDTSPECSHSNSADQSSNTPPFTPTTPATPPPTPLPTPAPTPIPTSTSPNPSPFSTQAPVPNLGFFPGYGPSPPPTISPPTASMSPTTSIPTSNPTCEPSVQPSVAPTLRSTTLVPSTSATFSTGDTAGVLGDSDSRKHDNSSTRMIMAASRWIVCCAVSVTVVLLV